MKYVFAQFAIFLMVAQGFSQSPEELYNVSKNKTPEALRELKDFLKNTGRRVALQPPVMPLLKLRNCVSKWEENIKSGIQKSRILSLLLL